jgi:hypothetical protein
MRLLVDIDSAVMIVQTQSQPPSKQQCACVSDDARECMRRRYPQDDLGMQDECAIEFQGIDRCECCCHDCDEDDYDDYE